MDLKRIMSTALLSLVLCRMAHAGTNFASHWYRPHALAGTESATERIQFLSVHMQPVTVSGDKFELTTGYQLARAQASASSGTLSFYFRRDSLAETPQLHLTWGLKRGTPLPTEESGSVVTTLYLREIAFFQIWNIPRTRDDATACVVPMHASASRNDVLCLESQDDAEQLVDALATLVKASGGNLRSPFGMWAQQGNFKDKQKRREMIGWTVSALDLDGPPAESGIQSGDVLFRVNGKPLRATHNFLSSFSSAASGVLDGGMLEVELARRGKMMTIALEYPELGSGEQSSSPQTSSAAGATVASAEPASAFAPPIVGLEGFQLSQRVLVEGEGLTAPAAAPPPTFSTAPSSAPLPLPAQAAAPVPAPSGTAVIPAATGTRMGVQIRTMTPSDAAMYRVMARTGIVILNVERGGMAEVMQLQAGDVIIEVNGAEVSTLDGFAQIVRSGALRSMRIWRNGQPVVLTTAVSL